MKRKSIDSYIAGACFSLMMLAGCHAQINYAPHRRIYKKKPADEKALCSNKSPYDQMKSTSNYTADDYHSAVGLTLSQFSGTKKIF